MATDNETAISPYKFHDIAVNQLQVSACEERVVGWGSTIWVSIRSVCKALNIDTTGQIRKLQRKPWARLRSDIMVRAADGKDRAMVVIDADCLPAWLSTIEPGRVSCELGDRLLVLQRRAAVAIREHFFGTSRRIVDSDGSAPDLTPGAKCSGCGMLAVRNSTGFPCPKPRCGTFVSLFPAPAPASIPTARQHLVATAEVLLDHAKAIVSARDGIGELKAELAQIRTAQQLAAGQLLALPPAPQVPPIPLRRWIEAVVSDLSAKIGKDHHDTWRLVYRGLKLHYGIDAYARAKNASKAAGREVAKIDVLESAGLLGEVYATARELVRQAEAGGVVDGPVVVAKR